MMFEGMYSLLAAARIGPSARQADACRPGCRCRRTHGQWEPVVGRTPFRQLVKQNFRHPSVGWAVVRRCAATGADVGCGRREDSVEAAQVASQGNSRCSQAKKSDFDTHTNRRAKAGSRRPWIFGWRTCANHSLPRFQEHALAKAQLNQRLSQPANTEDDWSPLGSGSGPSPPASARFRPKTAPGAVPQHWPRK